MTTKSKFATTASTTPAPRSISPASAGVASAKKASPILLPADSRTKAAATAAPVAKKASLSTSLAKAFATPKKSAGIPVTTANTVAAKPANFVKTSKVGELAKVPKVEKTEKAEKPKKPKLVRDSFTIPKHEYVVLDELKNRATQLKQPAKKSELLRAGIKALAAMSDAAFLKALTQVPAIKTGRPTKSD